MATSRALPVSSARPKVCRSLWRDTPYVHDTVTGLGSDSGRWGLHSALVSASTRVLGNVRAGDEVPSAVVSVAHVTTEMVLTRQCADVSMLMYHMRINGDVLDTTCSPPLLGTLAPR